MKVNFAISQKSYYESDAINYGTDGAVLLYNFRFWIHHNSIMGEKYFDGKFWVYYTQDQLARLFPQYTKRQIERILSNLEKDGAILKGNYNNRSYDRTTWYALHDQDEFLDTLSNNTPKLPELPISPNGEMDITKRGNGYHQTVISTFADKKTTNKKTTDDKSDHHHRDLIKVFDRVLEEYNAIAKMTDRNIIDQLTDADRDNIGIVSNRLKFGLEEWSSYFRSILDQPFLNGLKSANNGRYYKPGLSVLCRLETVQKITAGYYQDYNVEQKKNDVREIFKPEDKRPDGTYRVNFCPN